MGKHETDNQKTPNGIPYEFELAGKHGGRYFLMPPAGTSKKDIVDAKQYLRDNFDVVQITVESGVYKKKNGKNE